MIEFLSKVDFVLPNPMAYEGWLNRVVEVEDKILGDLVYSFCSDVFLDKLNREYLNHTDWTDVISFDHTIGSIVSGDIFISVDRVKENARKFEVSFEVELRRVMVHGLLHLLGFKDDTADNQSIMRRKENEMLNLFHVEH